MGRKRSTCSLSSQMVVEILSHVPDKPLFQFRCASKEWQSLIDLDLHWRALPYTMLGFFHRYCAVSHAGMPIAEVYYELQPPENNTGYEFCQTGSDRSSVDTALGFLPFCPDLEILDSCNGLLLCRSTTPVVVNYYVCNPAAKRWATVPDLDRLYDNVFLAFDPSASLHYKVLWITDHCDFVGDTPTRLGFRLYSSETGRWGEAKGVGTSMTQALVHRHGLFWDEAVYLTDNDRIIKFNIQEERFELIGLPDGFGNTFNSPDTTMLGRLAGRVCIAISKGSKLLIWVLDTHANGYEWRLKHSIGNMALPEREPSGFLFLSREITVIAFHQVLEIVFALRNRQIYSYDLKSMKFEVLCGVGSLNVFRTSILAYPYTPCLLDNLQSRDICRVRQ